MNLSDPRDLRRHQLAGGNFSRRARARRRLPSDSRRDETIERFTVEATRSSTRDGETRRASPSDRTRRRSSPSPVEALAREVLGDFLFPLVPVVEELLLIVQEFLVRVRGVLEVGALHDRVHRARLLAEAAVDALRHVDVVPRRAPRAVLAHLRLDRDRLRRADRLAELARDAALLARRVPPERVLAAEARAQEALLVRVVDRRLNQMELEGVIFQVSTNVGVDIDVDTLTKEFDAICLAGGSTIARDLEVPGRELQGIYPAMTYLPLQNKLNAGDAIDSDDFIDLTSILRESIIIELPIKKLCKDECKGLCASCGVDLNNNSCCCKKSQSINQLSELKQLMK